MLNSEILRTPNNLLVTLDTQRKFLLRMASQKLSCPACHTPCSQIEASDVAKGDIDKYPIDAADRDYHCPGCGRELIHDVYFMGSHGWRLTDAEADKLRYQKGGA